MGKALLMGAVVAGLLLLSMTSDHELARATPAAGSVPSGGGNGDGTGPNAHGHRGASGEHRR